MSKILPVFNAESIKNLWETVFELDVHDSSDDGDDLQQQKLE